MWKGGDGGVWTVQKKNNTKSTDVAMVWRVHSAHTGEREEVLFGALDIFVCNCIGSCSSFEGYRMN